VKTFPGNPLINNGRGIKIIPIREDGLGSFSLWRGPDGGFVIDPLLFSKIVGCQLVRERRNHLPADTGEPYRKAASLLGDNVCDHDPPP
jgi:hypothetical protein